MPAWGQALGNRVGTDPWKHAKAHVPIKREARPRYRVGTGPWKPAKSADTAWGYRVGTDP